MPTPTAPRTPIRRPPPVAGSVRQLNRETGEVLYFERLAPWHLCGGPVVPYRVERGLL